MYAVEENDRFSLFVALVDVLGFCQNQEENANTLFNWSFYP
jgi:hypothetical protein